MEFISSIAVFSYVLLLCWSISRREQNKIQARSFACGLDLSCYFLHFMIRSEYVDQPVEKGNENHCKDELLELSMVWGIDKLSTFCRFQGLAAPAVISNQLYTAKQHKHRPCNAREEVRGAGQNAYGVS